MFKIVTIYMLLVLLSLSACETKNPAEKQEEAMAESLAWQRAENKDTEFHYLKYGELFPNGKFLKEAEKRFDAIDAGKISKESLLGKRYTGYVEQFEDKQVLSLRFINIEEDDEGIYFQCMMNLGAIAKQLNGHMDPETNSIQFIEEGDGAQMKLQDGKVYIRDEKIVIESTELEQYWILD